MRRTTGRQGSVRVAIAAVAIAVVAGGVALQTLVRADSHPPAAAPAVLSAAAVPYLPYHTTVLTADDLAGDASIETLPSTLADLGFEAGAQRTFQGPSKHRLQLVVSRTLRFRAAGGARGFVRFVSDHAGDYVGQVPTVRPLTVDGRSGSLIREPACACHMAQPALLALVSSGRNVSWLEINGPAATREALVALLRLAP